jgi:uncharacterized protein (TIGR02265 family)
VTRPALKEFIEPSWKAPLDPQKTLLAIPESATIAGMFLEPIAKEARRLRIALTAARERYVAFRFYPVREHVRLLVEASGKFYPDRPLRLALRSLGRAAPAALLTSTLGRASVGSAQGTMAIIEAMAKSYAINLPGSSVSVLEPTKHDCIVRMQGVPYFLDSHHVGVFEGVLRYAGVKEGSVLLRAHSPIDAELWCRWGP